MSTTNSTGQKTSGTTAGRDRGGVPTDHLDLPYDAGLLGVDGAGETHLHSPKTDRVWVLTDDGDVTHVADVAGRSIWDWIEHVEGERGEWSDLRYSRGGAFENIAETIVRAQQNAEEADR